MNERKVTKENLDDFVRCLQEDERSPGTIENYVRHVREFGAWIGESPISKEQVAGWKEYLLSQGYCPGTVNTMIVSVNRFFHCMGWEDCKVKSLRIQRKMFREDSRELTEVEYSRLVAAAEEMGRERLVLPHGNHMLYGDSCQRGQIYHGRGPAKRPDRHFSQGKNPHNIDSGKTLPEADEILQKTKDRFWRGISHQKRSQHFKKTNMGGDEIGLCQGEGFRLKSFSSQFAPPFCAGVLPSV